jgi:P-type Cu+ transporter
VSDITADRATSGLQAELVVTGMSCGACAARIERRLNKLDGVDATVNYATGRAYFTAVGGRDPGELIGVIESCGYPATAPAPDPAGPGVPDAETRPLGRRLAVCVPLALAVIAAAMVPAAQFTGWPWVSLLLAAPVAVWGAWPLHRTAWAGLGHGAATMDTLVSMAVVVSFGWSLYGLLTGADTASMSMGFAWASFLAGQHPLYFDVAAGVPAAVLTGRYLEARARSRSAAALTALAGMAARTAAVLRDGAEQRVPVETLAADELFVVRPGEKIATDGVVAEGRSAVDASLVTGEATPAEVGPGDDVTGATLNMSGRLVVRATRVGGDTLLAQITRLVSEAQSTKASAQRLADRIAAIFVPGVITLAVVTLGFWLGAGVGGSAAGGAAVAVLVVACPCALGLATPMVLLAAVGRGAELGILVKSARALEAARWVQIVVLDKTGTVTTGTMRLVSVTTAPGVGEGEALRRAGAVEDSSEHPIGLAIAREAAARLGGLHPATGFEALPGSGVRGSVDGRAVTVGSLDFFDRRSLPVLPDLRRAVSQAETEGQTAVLAAWEDGGAGSGEAAQAVLVLADTLRPGAAEAVARIQRMGIRVALLTGDSERAARAVAAQLRIAPEYVLARVRPEEKAEVIRGLQGDGLQVAMVGDGVNDAAALAQADLGMATGTGTDAAIGAADLTLVSSDPHAIADALVLARVTLSVIRANLAWAFGYNVIAIPMAALGFLNPLIAGLAMSVSSLVVSGNSLQIRRFRPKRPVIPE